MKKVVRNTTIFLLLLLLTLLLVFRVRYGGGKYYPDISSEPAFDDSTLQRVVSHPEPIGNVAVSKDNRLFFTVHPESRAPGSRLYEWKDGKAVPFPKASVQKKLFQTVLGLAIGKQGKLWSIDHGNHGMGSARLLAFDLKTQKVVHSHVFSSKIAPLGSFLQDLQVDSKGETVYIADVSFWRKNPGIVVYDVKTKKARRVLNADPSVFSQNWIIRNPIKEMSFFGRFVTLKAGIDGIAITRDDKWLCYGAMNHDTLFRIRTRDLRNTKLSSKELSKKVVVIGKKPLSDGMSTDKESNVLVTDVEHGAIVLITPSGKRETLLKSKQIRWPGALSFGPEGWLYIADSALPEQIFRSRAYIKSKKPYYIYRFKPGNPGVSGQ